MLQSRFFLLTLALSSLAAYAETPAAQPKRPATEVVPLVNAATDSALEKLNFVELYFLKNAVMANSGYLFANDRYWLRSYFDESFAESVKSLPPCKPNGDLETCRIVPVCAQGCMFFDLSKFSFPTASPGFNFQSTPAMNSAMARIRQTQLKKLKSVADEKLLAPMVAGEMKSLPQIEVTGPISSFKVPFILGREGPSHEPNEEDRFQTSIVRDLKGDLSLLSLVDQFKKDQYEFDLAELLGMYLWNLDLLKKVILARSGRTFDEPLKGELIKLGVAPSSMSVGNLTPAAKEATSRIDQAIASLANGELNDLPESLRVRALEIESAALSYSGGM